MQHDEGEGTCATQSSTNMKIQQTLNLESALCIYLILTRHVKGIQQSFDEIKTTESPERQEGFSSQINGFLKLHGKLKQKNK